MADRPPGPRRMLWGRGYDSFEITYMCGGTDPVEHSSARMAAQ